jgi:lipopolysaccharide/colanic/teichoic acid biosynthesis glycosyltransferase
VSVVDVAGRTVGLRDPEEASWSTARAADSRVKRVLDVLGAVAALLLTLPVLLMAMLAIRCTSRGPVLFVQPRIGVDGRPFSLVKLRTMVVDNDERQHAEYVQALIDGRADRHGRLFKLADDPRRTRLGRVLRNWSVDELPQLVNVIRGEMSLVGPRPSISQEVALWDDRSRMRLAVRPGLTGLWQVSGRSRLTHLEMVELDLEYVGSWSHGLDARILLRTPIAILRRETA